MVVVVDNAREQLEPSNLIKCSLDYLMVLECAHAVCVSIGNCTYYDALGKAFHFSRLTPNG